MIKKISKHGDSAAILIDKPMLELLNIDEETQLRISTDGKNIIIEPVRASQQNQSVISDDARLQKIYEKIAAKYDQALRELAKK